MNGFLTIVLLFTLHLGYEQRAKTEIEALGGTVYFEKDWVFWLRIATAYTPQATFDTAKAVGFDRPKVATDATMKSLLAFRNLEILSVDEGQITGEGMKYVGRMQRLTDLYLWSTPITDEGLRPLRQLRDLQELKLRGSMVTDRGLEHLGQIPSLQLIVLNGTQITGSGLKHLAGLRNLRALYLDGTTVPDTGFLHLSGMNLECLSLSNTLITDISLQTIALPKLEVLYIDGTDTSKAAVEDLKKRIPGLSVAHWKVEDE